MIVQHFRNSEKLISVEKNGSFCKQNNLLMKEPSSGFYIENELNEILVFYFYKNVSFLQFKGIKIMFFGSDVKLDCFQINNNSWIIECEQFELKIKFCYTPYFYDPFDDDNETDVNFGLWLLELKKDPFRYNRVKSSFSKRNWL
jgi:hypothetical protein